MRQDREVGMTTTRTWRGYVFIATSLDGFIARDDGDIGWLTDPPANPGHGDDETSPCQRRENGLASSAGGGFGRTPE